MAYASNLLGRQLQPGDITSEAYWQQYGLNDKQAINLVHGYNLAGFPALLPLPGALQVLKHLKRHYELHVITSRDPVSKQYTETWIKQHFADTFTDIVLAGNTYVSKNPRTKAAMCIGIGADYIIDDSVRHLLDCAKQGTKALLFGHYGWHEHGDLPHGIIRVRDWQEVKEYFDGIHASK